MGALQSGCSLTRGFGGNCPGEGAALLPEFASGMSPALVQPAARDLEDSPCAQEKKKSCILLKGGRWGLSQNVGSEEFLGVGELLCICEVQGAEHL